MIYNFYIESQEDKKEIETLVAKIKAEILAKTNEHVKTKDVIINALKYYLEFLQSGKI